MSAGIEASKTNKPMFRVAFFSEYYPPHIGGVEFRVRDLAAQLAALGHDVTVFTIGYDKKLRSEEYDGAVRIVRCPAHGYDQPLGPLPRNPLQMLVYALWCRRMAGGAFDLLIYEEFPILHALLAPRLARRRAMFDWCERRNHPLFRIIQRTVPRLFRWNTATSPGVAAKISAESGCEVISLPSGVLCKNYTAKPASQRSGIVYLGRLYKHKNLPLVISSFEELCRRGYQGNLTIVGNGPEWEPTLALVQASAFAARITMAGEVDDAAKNNYLAGAEVMFLLSSREGFPVTLSEAMASSLPIVTVDLPDNGGSDVVKAYKSGLSVSADANSVANAAQDIMTDWERWSQNCRESATRLEWATLVNDLLSAAGLH